MPADLDLARTLTARPRFRWAAGMRATAGATYNSRGVRIINASARGIGLLEWEVGHGRLTWDTASAAAHLVLDLADDPTGGALLGVLAEELGSMGLALSEVLDLYVSGVLPLADAIGRGEPSPPVPSLGEVVARALISVWGEP